MWPVAQVGEAFARRPAPHRRLAMVWACTRYEVQLHLQQTANAT